MDEILKLIGTFLLGTFGTAFAIGALLFFYPEKVEKWWSIILKVLISLGITVKGLHKRYVLHDLQGRVNDFVKTNCSDLPGAGASRVKLQWIDGSVSKQAILDGNTVVVRVRRDDPHEKNFVHGVCLFVSKSLLLKVKRYISAPQGEAVDLYVSMKLLEKEKPSVVDHFVADYLHPAMDDKKSATARIFDDLSVVDEGKLLFPIYLRELEFLGDKVFGGRKDAVIIEEVNKLVTFLKTFVKREIGAENVDLNFLGSYCRFAVVIVGKAGTLLRESIKPYVSYIQRDLLPANVETIYLIGPERNRNAVLAIAEEFAERFEAFASLVFKRKLYYKDKHSEKEQFLLVMRARGRQLYYPKTA